MLYGALHDIHIIFNDALFCFVMLCNAFNFCHFYLTVTVDYYCSNEDMINTAGNPFMAFASAMAVAQQMSLASLGNQMNPFAAFLAASMASGMNPALMNAVQQFGAAANAANPSGDAAVIGGSATGGHETVPPAAGKGKNCKKNKKSSQTGQANETPRSDNLTGSQGCLNSGTVQF